MQVPGSVARSSSSPDQVSRLAADPAPAPSHEQQQEFANQCKEFQMEIEKISSHVEHLKSQNHVLTLTLEESKTTCDSLTELLGR